MYSSIDNLCEEAGAWSCPTTTNSFSVVSLWGLVGSYRLMGTKAEYFALNWFVLGGFLVPIPFWLIWKASKSAKIKVRPFTCHFKLVSSIESITNKISWCCRTCRGKLTCQCCQEQQTNGHLQLQSPTPPGSLRASFSTSAYSSTIENGGSVTTTFCQLHWIQELPLQDRSYSLVCCILIKLVQIGGVILLSTLITAHQRSVQQQEVSTLQTNTLSALFVDIQIMSYESTIISVPGLFSTSEILSFTRIKTTRIKILMLILFQQQVLQHHRTDHLHALYPSLLLKKISNYQDQFLYC